MKKGASRGRLVTGGSLGQGSWLVWRFTASSNGLGDGQVTPDTCQLQQP